MHTTIVALVLLSFSVGARSELDRGACEQFTRQENILARISELPDEKAIIRNQIMAAVSRKVNSSLIEVRDVEKELQYRGKTLIKVLCVVLNRPCIAYLARVDEEWEVVMLTTTQGSQPHTPLDIVSN